MSDTTIEAEVLPAALPDDLQEIAIRYVAARRKANESTLEAAEALAEARTMAAHREWYKFLEATNTSEDLADRLLAIHAEAQRSLEYRETVVKGWLPQTQAALVARPSTPPEAKAAVVAQAQAAGRANQPPPSKRQVEQTIQSARGGGGGGGGGESKSRTGAGFAPAAPAPPAQPIELIPMAPTQPAGAPTVLASVAATPAGLPPVLQLGAPAAPAGALPPMLFGAPAAPQLPPVSPVRSVARNDDDFYAGMITALAVVAMHDQETIFREIVATADEAALVAFAIRDDSLGFSGLAMYGYGKPAKPAKPSYIDTLPRSPDPAADMPREFAEILATLDELEESDEIDANELARLGRDLQALAGDPDIDDETFEDAEHQIGRLRQRLAEAGES